MPAGFPVPRGHELSEVEELPAHADYWRPLVFKKDELANPLGDMNYLSIVRLKPAATSPQLLADMIALEKVIAKRFPEPVELDPVVRSLQQAMAQELKLPLLALMGAVSAVMLIVCINLMNLMSVRAIGQRRDWAIRLAVGASARNLIGQALCESLLLSAVGALFGTLLALWFLQLVRLKAPVDLPRIEELVVDPAALLFAIGLSVASALLFGLWPAWRAARVDAQEALQSSGRTTTEGRRGRRAGQALVAAEVALSTVLLLSGGLLLRSFVKILNVNPGLQVRGLLTVRIDLPPDKYRDQTHRYSLYRQVKERVAAMPGVEAVGYVSDLPVTGENNNNPATAGDRPIPPLPQWPLTNYRYASADYFKAAGIPLNSGRVFEDRESKSNEVILSANLAAQLWPDQNAIDRPLRIYGNDHAYRVIGVVGAVHAASLTQGPTRMIYFPDGQHTESSMSLVVRTTAEPKALSPAIRHIILKLEPEAAIPSMRTMREVIAGSLSQKRFQLVLLIGFAVTALLLASLGIYGVLAFATGRRTSEIGLRMALGARSIQVLKMTFRSGMTPVLTGILLWFASAAASMRLMQSMLFEVKALDPLVYLSTAALLVGVAALSCFLPARRAARLNTVEALRYQ
jgi:putative ABC transport system permease protein